MYFNGFNEFLIINQRYFWFLILQAIILLLYDTEVRFSENLYSIYFFLHHRGFLDELTV